MIIGPYKSHDSPLKVYFWPKVDSVALLTKLMKAGTQEYNFEVTTCELILLLKIVRLSKLTYHAQVQYQIYISYKFWLVFIH